MRSNGDWQTVEGSASLIDLQGYPRATRVTPEADGMFKETESNRGSTMADGVDV
jgi:hypothetical protein